MPILGIENSKNQLSTTKDTPLSFFSKQLKRDAVDRPVGRLLVGQCQMSE